MKIIMSPHHRLADDPKPSCPPADREAFEALVGYTDMALKEMGLQKWGRPDNKPDGPMLWLYPGEWYEFIPDGLPITNIFFEQHVFKRGKTDDDIRFDCLSFGFLKP